MGLRRLLALLIGAVLLVPVLLINPVHASAATVQAVDLLAALTVAPEQSGSYDRDRFRHWIDADGDGCDTRAEVLKLESQIGVTVEGKCKVVKGRWHSWFDGVTETAATKLDIDHFVPLAEAWRSGARAWTDKQREAFANDLNYEWSLEAVTASSNRSKGDRDPADWLPPNTSAHCQYAQAWVGVKYRWRLTMDQREYNTLSRLLSGTCGRASVDLPQRAIGGSAATVKPSGPGTSAPRTFSDVPRNHGFAKEIAWLGNSGISEGWAKNGRFEYRPRNQISREAMAAFMYRLAELENHPSVARFQAPAKTPFKDVPTEHAFYKEITWLADRKITTGYDDGTFKPGRKITREAMAAFMHRYADLSGRSTSRPSSSSVMLFDDVVPKHAFYREITWMGTSGVSTGYLDKAKKCQDYRPRSQVTREAMAAFMYRFAHGEGTGLTRGCITPPPNPGDVKNCGDFKTWKDANAWFQRYFRFYGDVARLDADKDGVPCQTLPGAPKR